MNDTSALISNLIAQHHDSMTPAERWRVVSSMFETARKIVDSSLAADLTVQQRRLAVARRIYGGELPEAALLAHAEFEMHDQNAGSRSAGEVAGQSDSSNGIVRAVGADKRQP
jgi:hypothetical protein